jgi:hypothetical protein
VASSRPKDIAIPRFEQDFPGKWGSDRRSMVLEQKAGDFFYGLKRL